MALMFTSTPSIKKAVALINDLDGSKFPLVLSRIIQKIHLKDERTFTEDEEERLESTLNLAGPEFELVLETLEFFLHQAAYHTAKPAVLGQQLSQLEMNEEKVKTIVDTWTNAARDVVQKLRQQTLLPNQLEDINWRLNLQMAQSTKTKMKLPNAMFEFKLEDVNWRLNLQMAQSTKTKMKLPNAMFEFKVRNNDNTDTDKIRVEFTHDELYKFYNQLETIQKQIDNLS